MSSNNIPFSVNISDVRAINSASIDLSGITVMSGCNGSGKSTVSKIVYGYLYADTNFEKIVVEQYYSKFFHLADLLMSICHSDDSFFYSISNFELICSNSFWENIFNQYDLDYKKFVDSGKRIPIVSINRYKRVFNEIVGKKQDITTTEELISEIKTSILNLIDKVKEISEKRDVKYLELLYNQMFNEKNSNWKYQFYEYGDSLLKKGIIEKQHSFSKVIYVDMTETIWDSTFKYSGRTFRGNITNNFLDFLRNDDKQNSPDEKILQLFSDIMNGSVSEQSVSLDYIFTTKKGETYSLSQCATGIKSFAILEMLCKKGHFGKNTLIIIDEPEVHLHPQWVIEYARLIIKINQITGTRFLLASHNPDFISALSSISEKEQTDVCFYLSKQDEEKSDCYDFINLGKNIEPIFESFNIALDRIYEYSKMD